jgi:hypothetical protein
MSASPNSSIVSLLRVCTESCSVVKKQYSLILPESSTWFSFAKDWLYLDWGGGGTVPYAPRHFTPSFPEWIAAYQYGHPEINEHVAGQVRNLVIYQDIDYHKRNKDEEWLIQDVMSVFTDVELLVIADRFHGKHKSSDELVWLQGALGDEENYQSEINEDERLILRNLILWRDGTQYNRCADIDEQKLRKEWEKYRGEGDKMPKLFKKSITTADVKQSMLDICGSERNFRKFATLDWEFVTGHQNHTGDLSLSQQISFLELALEQISSKTWCREEGIEKEGKFVWDISVLGSKIDALVVEREMLELLTNDA